MTLNPQQFFHGTGHDIEGPHVLPGAKIGQLNYDYPSENLATDRPNRVFVSPDESEAWSWAQGPGRTRVHAVQPLWNTSVPKPQIGEEVTTPRARILSTIDIHTPLARFDLTKKRWARDTPMQGTLPPVNWEDYGAPNHPTYEQVVRNDRKPTYDAMVEHANAQPSAESKIRSALHPQLFNTDQFDDPHEEVTDGERHGRRRVRDGSIQWYGG